MNNGLSKANTKRNWTCEKCQKALHCNAGAFKSHVRWCGIDYDPIFWSRVEKTEGCWLWKGALQRDGYAHFRRDGKTISSHRYAYEKLVGPIPEGMDLLHSCDVRHCVNPAHLRPGTHQENMAECRAKGRATQGERNRQNKLTEEQVREIRRLFVRTGPKSSNSAELAERFGVQRNHIIGIVERKTYWKHLL